MKAVRDCQPRRLIRTSNRYSSFRPAPTLIDEPVASPTSTRSKIPVAVRRVDQQRRDGSVRRALSLQAHAPESAGG